jgi:hypothetical protein
MKTQVSYFYEEFYASCSAWISCCRGYKWTLDQCRENVMARKAISPRSKLRIVKETRETWDWRERSKVK